MTVLMTETGRARGRGLLALLVLTATSFAAVAHEPFQGSLPLGDGKRSSAPKVGALYGCPLPPGGGGAQAAGPWIKGATWVPAEKAVVGGDVAWPEAKLEIKRVGGERIVTGNALPAHATGIFPVRPSEPGYAYDRNPNRIGPRPFEIVLPTEPRPAAQASCVGGPVGVTLSGVVLFDAVDALGRDAPAHEIQDRCNGHPQRQGLYHYHGFSPCVPDAAGAAGRHSDLIGYAFDGFGIFGLKGEGGRELTNADLDECHGHSHSVDWDGRRVEIYHYHLTREFPYSLGCYRGTPRRVPGLAGGPDGHGGPGGPGGPGGRPPPR